MPIKTKTMSFIDQSRDLCKLAEAAIRQFPGKTVLFDTQAEDADEDGLSELPFLVYVSKHSIYDEHAVVAVEVKEDGNVLLHSVPKSGESSSLPVMVLDELDLINTLHLADVMIAHHASRS